MKIPIYLSLFLILFVNTRSTYAQATSHSALAQAFIRTLNEEQRAEALYLIDSKERFNWHFVPQEGRKGIYLKHLSESQQAAAFALLKSYLSEKTYNKTREIIEFELLLRELEKRKEDDWMRDPTRYAFIFFGDPSDKGAWGWRFEGHHISFSFSTIGNKIISGTPGFLGANPAIVTSGPHKGKQVLKDESEAGFNLVRSLNASQFQKAKVAGATPNDILTYINREARIDKPEGIFYSELLAEQKALLIKLLNVYVSRYTEKYAKDMIKEIRKSDINKLKFVWAGATESEIGKAHYYRIQGPTIIIEFDNSQNNANHIHTVVRDLKHDFGGDKLLQHYKKGHHHD
ncbi:MAG TPA: DUF3500 domain-containing protein [Pedobacter sp.]|jgi:hypothetical protein